jgi:hypothetical protein
MQEKVILLNKVKQKYPINDELMLNIRNALNFDASKNDLFLIELYADLPVELKMELMMVVHESSFNKFPFFRNLGNRHFVTWVSS